MPTEILAGNTVSGPANAILDDNQPQVFGLPFVTSPAKYQFVCTI